MTYSRPSAANPPSPLKNSSSRDAGSTAGASTGGSLGGGRGAGAACECRGSNWSARLPRCPTNTDRKSTRLNSSHSQISYAVFCLKKKKQNHIKKIERDN